MTNEREAPLKHLQGKLERLLANESYADQLGRALTGREAYGNALKDYVGKDAKTIDSTLAEEQATDALRQEILTRTPGGVLQMDKERTLGYADENLPEILRAIPSEKIAPFYNIADEKIGIKPYEINGDKIHNERVKKHKRAIEYREALKDESKFKRIILPEVEKLREAEFEAKKEEEEKKVRKNIDERLSEKASSNNKYVSQKSKEDFKNFIAPLIAARAASEYIGKKDIKEYAVEVAQRATKEFEDSFEDNRTKAEYGRRNIEASYRNSKTEEEKLGILRYVDAVAKGAIRKGKN